jgi:hypothetical protein
VIENNRCRNFQPLEVAYSNWSVTKGKLNLKTKTGNHDAGKDKHQPGSQIRSDS